MTVYYNENDPHAAEWLRALIKNGLIPAGDVDERSIEDVRPIDIDHYNQCHFFAGLGGWAYALDLAGWPRDRPVWTGSCPCQPFSTAGKGAGFEDERHLWPAWQHLIAQCLPPVVFGEQVASKAADPWIDLVQSDMEGLDYAFGCIPFPAAGVGAPHIRERTYFVAADPYGKGLQGIDWAGEFGAPEKSSAWSELAGVHAAGNWGSWVSESGAGAIIDGLSAKLVRKRIARTRAYGNAIVPYQAAAFVRSYLESRARLAEAA